MKRNENCPGLWVGERAIPCECHLTAALNAVGSGIPAGALRAGWFGNDGSFKPFCLVPKDVITIPSNDNDARVMGREWSRYQRNEAEKIAGDHPRLNTAIAEWDSLFKMPFVSAIRDKKTGRVYSEYVTHGTIIGLHPWIKKEDIEFGFLHDNGSFMGRRTAAAFLDAMAEINTGSWGLVSGQEFIPIIKSEEEIELYKNRLHFLGAAGISFRQNILEKSGYKDMAGFLQKLLKNHLKELKKWQR